MSDAVTVTSSSRTVPQRGERHRGATAHAAPY
jgi:hypothetical protein